MKRTAIAIFAATAALLMSTSGQARADTIIYESGTGTTNALPAQAVGTGGQIVGSRFTLTQETDVTAVGGVFSGTNIGTIYAAILEMTGPLPQGDPFNGTEVLTSTVFTATGTGDSTTPLSINLPAGDYALVFGSDLFGASGFSSMPFDGADIAAGAGSYFIYTGGFGNPFIWKQDIDSGYRFLVIGNAVPEPTSLALLGLGGLALLCRRRDI